MPSFVWLSHNMAKYIIEEGQRLVDIGFGDEENGVLDTIPMETEAYRYTTAVVGFLRMVVGVIRYNYYEADSMEPLLNLDFGDDWSDNEI
jgi:hypothetical protein